MSEIKVNNIQSFEGTHGPEISGTVEMNSTGAMSLPRGDTAYRGGRGRGIFAGGQTPAIAVVNTIEYVTISTLGNANDFGDLSGTRRGPEGCSSSTRGIIAGALAGNTIDYITISSTGNGFDFGDLTIERFTPGGASNNTRGIFAGGYHPTGSIFRKSIDYITIASLGNASNFGDMLDNNMASGAVSDTTRAIFGGGCKSEGPTGVFNTIQYVTISTTGNTEDFGNLTVARDNSAASSNSIRGIFGGGDTETPASENATDVIDYITIASLGDALDFGNLTSARERFRGCSSSTRSLFAGGFESPARVNTIEKVEIATTANATDFGDLTTATRESASCSDSHGGLG